MQHFSPLVSAVALSTLLSLGGPAIAEQTPVDVCHLQGDGTYQRITVTDIAYDTHVAHGDASPGDPFPGDLTLSFAADCTLICDAGPTGLPGDGQEGTALDFSLEHGPALSYTDNCAGDGTFIDNNTGLMWECKTDDNTIHDKDTTYPWTASEPAADGALFTTFVATLNTEPCFAEHCDWRIPTVKELQSIIDYSKSAGVTPTASVPGPTKPSNYWSSTSHANDPHNAWYVSFFNGNMGSTPKLNPLHARAVRSAQ